MTAAGQPPGCDDELVHAEIAGWNARLGAMLAAKGLTPDEVTTLVRDHVHPLLDELLQRAAEGEDIGQLQFVVEDVAGRRVNPTTTRAASKPPVDLP